MCKKGASLLCDSYWYQHDSSPLLSLLCSSDRFCSKVRVFLGVASFGQMFLLEISLDIAVSDFLVYMKYIIETCSLQSMPVYPKYTPIHTWRQYIMERCAQQSSPVYPKYTSIHTWRKYNMDRCAQQSTPVYPKYTPIHTWRKYNMERCAQQSTPVYQSTHQYIYGESTTWKDVLSNLLQVHTNVYPGAWCHWACMCIPFTVGFAHKWVSGWIWVLFEWLISFKLGVLMVITTDRRFYCLIPVWMTLTVIQGHRGMRKQQLCDNLDWRDVSVYVLYKCGELDFFVVVFLHMQLIWLPAEMKMSIDCDVVEK